MSDIKKLVNSFKTDDELHMFISAQQSSIIEVSKKIKSLEDENEKLKKQIEIYKLGQVAKDSEALGLMGDGQSEIICKTQIDLLKSASDERLLTLEESKKLDTYVKILGQISLAKKTKDSGLKDKSDAELFQLISGGKSES